MAEGGFASQDLRRRAPAALLGVLAVAGYAFIAVFTLFHAQTFTAEVSALVRGWWYATGAVTPYAGADMPQDMPLYFYEVGFWQRLTGAGHLTGRLLSILLGAASGLLLFGVCRKLTGNTAVAAAAAFMFLATPATSFFFATATPAATLSLLHLIAIWLIVDGIGKPRAAASAVMGLVCAAIYFMRQDMLLSIVVLAPLYVLAVGRDRGLQAAIVLGALAVSAGVVLALFPARFHTFALDLPLIGAALGDADLLGPDYTLIARGTHGGGGFGAAFDSANLIGFLDSFLLPNLGTCLLAVALFVTARGPLRVLWIAPLYFFWLALAHYTAISAEAGCTTCMHPVTPAFAAVGALAAALTLATSGQWAKRHGVSPGTAIVAGALIAVALNTLAPRLASAPAARAFPGPLLDSVTPPPELSEIPALTRWLAGALKTKDPVLVIHGLGESDVAALPYAVTAAGHTLAPISLDLRATRRTINQSLVGDMRASVRDAVEDSGLWSGDTLRRWIERDYNVVVFQDDPAPAVAAVRKSIEAAFDVASATRYRGHQIIVFTRKTAR